MSTVLSYDFVTKIVNSAACALLEFKNSELYFQILSLLQEDPMGESVKECLEEDSSVESDRAKERSKQNIGLDTNSSTTRNSGKNTSNKKVNIENVLHTFPVLKEYTLVAFNSLDSEENDSPELLESVEKCLNICSEDQEVLCAAAACFLRLGDGKRALSLIQKSCDLNPCNISVLETKENILCQLVERWHFIMLNDKARNLAFKTAIEQVLDGLDSGARVTDVGCGTGLLSIFAALQEKCKAVVAIESSTIMYELAKDVVGANSCSDKVILVNKLSTDLHFTENKRADVLVTETFDAALFGEGILSTLCHAWTHLLNNESVVIPAKASVYIQAIESYDIRARHNFVDELVFDISLGDAQICSHVGYTEAHPYSTQCMKSLPQAYRTLSDAVKLIDVDFNNFQELLELKDKIEHKEVCLEIVETGQLDAMCLWFTLHLTDSVNISTQTSYNSCWEQAIFPMNKKKTKSDTSSTITAVDGEKLYIKYDTYSGKLRMWPNRLESNSQTSVTKMFHRDPPDLINELTFPLPPDNVSYLNNFNYNKAIQHSLSRFSSTSTKQHNLFISLMNNFSFFPIQALKLGFSESIVIAASKTQVDLYEHLRKSNSLETKVEILDSISSLIDSDQLKRRYRTTDQSVCFILDVVDGDGRLSESLATTLETIRQIIELCDKNTIFNVIPARFQVLGFLIQSEELEKKSHIKDHDSTLGVEVKENMNKYSTRNHQGLNLSSLTYTQLTETFEMFSVDLAQTCTKDKTSRSSTASRCHSDTDSKMSFDKYQNTSSSRDANGRFSSQNTMKVIEMLSIVKVPVISPDVVSALVYWFHLDAGDEDLVNTCSSDWHQAAVLTPTSQTISAHLGQSINLECRLENSAIAFSILEQVT